MVINRFLILFFCGVLLFSCKYRPFVKYYFPQKKTEFPRFNKTAHLQGENNENRNNYDVEEYDLLIKLFPEEKRFEGVAKIIFTAQTTNPTLQLDAFRRLSILNITADHELADWKTKKDMLFVSFSSPLVVGETYSIEIDYHGKLPEIMEGPIMWKKDRAGNDWISSQLEGIGPHYVFPCKDLLYDEAQSVFIRVEVPLNLKVVANGTLQKVTSENHRKTFHYFVANPINVYNISFNVGNFTQIDIPYTDINGIDRNIEVHAIGIDKEKAAAFYQQVTTHMAIFEELYGSFPWWGTDGCRFVQTAHELGAMEHQSAIAMGQDLTNDYTPMNAMAINTTLVHELAHEWWGNSVSADDYAHAWIHEGFATYSEALAIEKIYGSEHYDNYFSQFIQYYSENKRPMVKPEGVRYNSWVHHKDQDIYFKGALLLHTVRKQLNNDSLFLASLKSAYQHFSLKNINSSELMNYFNKELNVDYTTLFNNYFHYSTPPTVQCTLDSKGKLSYRWKTINEPFDFKVIGRNGDERFTIHPKKEIQTIQLNANRPVEFNVADFGYVKMELVDKFD